LARRFRFLIAREGTCAADVSEQATLDAKHATRSVIRRAGRRSQGRLGGRTGADQQISRSAAIVPEDGGDPREYSLPRGVHVNVQEGDRVRAGEPLMDGPSNPHDILSVLGEKALHACLVNEIQEVYRLQGVNINDKHIEVIVRQMMRWVKIEDVGDTEFLIDEQVDRFRFMEENERVIMNGGRPASGRPLLLGITRASLSTDSFISACAP
jgi:DNA-directed RNA polymerase subunit beta'